MSALNDPAYVAQLERDFLAHEERVSVTWVDEHIADMQAGRICKDCGSEPVVYDGLCADCARWAHSKFNGSDPSMAVELSEGGAQ